MEAAGAKPRPVGSFGLVLALDQVPTFCKFRAGVDQELRDGQRGSGWQGGEVSESQGVYISAAQATGQQDLPSGGVPDPENALGRSPPDIGAIQGADDEDGDVGDVLDRELDPGRANRRIRHFFFFRHDLEGRERQIRSQRELQQDGVIIFPTSLLSRDGHARGPDEPRGKEYGDGRDRRPAIARSTQEEHRSYITT